MFFANNVKLRIQIVAYLLFKFSQRKARFLSRRQSVGGFQPPTVNKMRHAVYMVLELIFSVSTD